MTIFPVFRETLADDLEIDQGGWVSVEDIEFGHGCWYAFPQAIVRPFRTTQDDVFIALTNDGLVLTSIRPLHIDADQRADGLIIETLEVLDGDEFIRLPGYRHLASSQAGLASHRYGPSSLWPLR